MNLLGKIPALFDGEMITREEACRVCKEKSGRQIAVVEFWDIKKSMIVRCEKCHHMQLDPMLTDAETDKGCQAYYIEESLRTSRNEQKRNCIRNFRRGVVFGYQLMKKGVSPQSILEIGPGSGYFSAGIRFVFPACEITVLDINNDVLEFNSRHHSFKTIRDVPDHFADECHGKFDLVVARDILEHVSDISQVLSNLARYLKPEGYLHFITPNGHEDVWKHYLTSRFANSVSELLINHVNYFDGDGLKNMLIRSGLYPVEYYSFGFKTTIKGAGWKKVRNLFSPTAGKNKADFFINMKKSEIDNDDYSRKEILDQWYIRTNARWVTRLVCLYHHFTIIRTAPELKIGHEFYGLFIKSASVG